MKERILVSACVCLSGPFRVCVCVQCSVFNIGSECFAPVAAGRPSGELQLRRDLEARRSGREESVLLTVISTGLLIHR